MTASIILNGQTVSAEDARISVHEAGWLHGAGLFETMRAENGIVFRLEAHLARLCRSAEKILSPIDRQGLPSKEDFSDLFERNGLLTARVRLTVSSGPVDASKDDRLSGMTVCVTAVALPSPDASAYQKGVSVVISAYRQSTADPTAGHKTTCYLPRLIALREAQQLRCAEAIWFTTNNMLAEGCISNVWIVKNEKLKTPALDTPVLPGIARAAVLELAAGQGIGVSECPLTIDDLLDADEVFLTNSIMQVLPVVRVEKHDIRDAKVGAVAKGLLEAYRGLVKKECGQRGSNEA